MENQTISSIFRDEADSFASPIFARNNQKQGLPFCDFSPSTFNEVLYFSFIIKVVAPAVQNSLPNAGEGG